MVFVHFSGYAHTSEFVEGIANENEDDTIFWS